ncbi:type 1 glutamine amidotransferase [Rhizobium sp. PAMB 3174]
MRILAVENMAGTEHGLVGEALAEAGIAPVIRRPYAGDTLPAGHAEFDALIVFGGTQNALDDEAHPYLPALARLMRDFGDSGKAVLGLCLGSQILARAYGAANIVGTATEFGWCEIAPTAEGARDQLLSGLAGGFRAFEWHDDTFTLPQGAVHLAAGATVPNQAFRVGEAAYGFQCHFEAGTRVVERWSTEFADAALRMDPDWPRRHASEAALHGAPAHASGMAIARAWIGVARRQAARRSEAMAG